MSSTGATYDCIAFESSPIYTLHDKLPSCKFLIGDGAYPCTDHLVTPFSGSLRHDPDKSNYNYFISESRSTIEQAFGLLAGKWRILHSPMQTKVKTCSLAFVCMCTLHNYCIDRSESIDIDPYDSKFSTYNRNIRVDHRRHILSEEFVNSKVIHADYLRNLIMKEIKKRKFKRPGPLPF